MSTTDTYKLTVELNPIGTKDINFSCGCCKLASYCSIKGTLSENTANNPNPPTIEPVLTVLRSQVERGLGLGPLLGIYQYDNYKDSFVNIFIKRALCISHYLSKNHLSPNDVVRSSYYYSKWEDLADAVQRKNLGRKDLN